MSVTDVHWVRDCDFRTDHFSEEPIEAPVGMTRDGTLIAPAWLIGGRTFESLVNGKKAQTWLPVEARTRDEPWDSWESLDEEERVQFTRIARSAFEGLEEQAHASYKRPARHTRRTRR